MNISLSHRVCKKNYGHQPAIIIEQILILDVMKLNLAALQQNRENTVKNIR